MQLIIFDVGGILTPDATESIIYPALAQLIGISLEQFNEATKELKPRVTEGTLTLREMYAQVIARFHSHILAEKVLEKHKQLYIQHATKRDAEIIALIEKLKINYEVVCLTNAEPEIAAYNIEDGLYSYFEKVFLSTELHMKKPDIHIYKKVLEACNCPAEEALLIDDKEEYADGAVDAGLNVILFHNKKQLIKDLQTLDIQT
jgi:HAD superfamily hydrolase (TIGR01509 family)